LSGKANARLEPDGKARLTPCAPHGVLERLGDKWTIMVLCALSEAAGHRLRFSELKDAIAGISQRMLTITLRHLERDGLLIRHFFPEVPPRVEYELTEMGRSMLPALAGFTGWIKANWLFIEAARSAYDARTIDPGAHVPT